MKKTKRLWVIGAIAGALLIIGVLVFDHLNKQPHNLGPELEYIGKAEYGCWMPWVCDSGPGAKYFFATDLTIDDLKVYFKNAQHIPRDNVLGGGNGDYNYDSLYFKPKNGDDEFVINYYDNTQVVIDTFQLRESNKKFVVSMGDFFFAPARNALE